MDPLLYCLVCALIVSIIYGVLKYVHQLQQLQTTIKRAMDGLDTPCRPGACPPIDQEMDVPVRPSAVRPIHQLDPETFAALEHARKTK